MLRWLFLFAERAGKRSGEVGILKVFGELINGDIKAIRNRGGITAGIKFHGQLFAVRIFGGLVNRLQSFHGIIVAGKNFGCGSSREQAPEIIKALGVQCVIAKSFARIFFRNSINNGLLLIEQPTLYDDIKEGDTISVVMNEHVDYNGKTYPIASLPENLMSIIRAGGLVKAMRKLNGLD